MVILVRDVRYRYAIQPEELYRRNGSYLLKIQRIDGIIQPVHRSLVSFEGVRLSSHSVFVRSPPAQSARIYPFPIFAAIIARTPPAARRTAPAPGETARQRLQYWVSPLDRRQAHRLP
ncbi:hypothetical protein [Paraburkholderia dinghuensis]|uniref:Uncharacterized protein n=1 Tax=Paraburkholderia dinghuensis TaxID=2305225 RepID=A0A3N6N6Y3_9BURK|nr:hypothetical protein [Paraburkholderia dinghuensis]RQH04702.1 hypothetical protein D1Y85_17595 [Paraburkholderia dinghuensis]